MGQNKEKWNYRDGKLDAVILKRYNTILDCDPEVAWVGSDREKERLAAKKTAIFLELDEGYVLKVVEQKEGLIRIRKPTYGGTA